MGVGQSTFRLRKLKHADNDKNFNHENAISSPSAGSHSKTSKQTVSYPEPYLPQQKVSSKLKHKTFNDKSAVPKAQFMWTENDGTMRWKDDAKWKDDAQVLLKAVTSNDEKERVTRHHKYMKIIMHGNFMSPLHELLASGGANVLEIGCGEGTWTLENAADYPNSTFHGVDINAKLFPSSKPANVSFIEADITKGIPYNDETFDFVFCRSMFWCVTKEEWPPLVKEILRVCKYEGFIEFVDNVMVVYNAGPEMTKWFNTCNRVLKSWRLDLDLIDHIKDIIDQSSDGEVVIMDYISIPIGGPRVEGKLMKIEAKIFMGGFKQALLPLLNMTSEEYDEFVWRCFEEWTSYESFINYHYSVAQKRRFNDEL